MVAPGATVDTESLCSLALDRGLVAAGVCRAEPFPEVRAELERRRDAGMHGGMSFTYRRPEVAADPTRSLPDARSLIVGAMPTPVDRRPLADAPAGFVARYVHDGAYDRLREVLTEMAGVLKAAGFRARVLCDDNALHDREAAHRAGLGWYGKNANLLVPGHGSWVVLGSVLTDAELEPSPAPVDDGCGTCRRCLDGCPTGAIVAPGVVDARLCLAWLVQARGSFPRHLREALGHRLYGCDDCQEVCPPNRRFPPPEATGRGDGAWVELLALLEADDETLLERHGRWYIPGRDPRYLRRNALVVLGNVADPADPGVEAALRRHLAHDDPLLREHAAWAAVRLGRTDLAAAVADDPHPEVRAEVVGT